jgi:hypothetical protein
MVNKYENVKFIKISNNNNPCKDFYIDISTMKDARLRLSALKSQFKKYILNPEELTHREVFKYFIKDYSFYVIEKGAFNCYEDAKLRRDELYKIQYERMNPI